VSRNCGKVARVVADGRYCLVGARDSLTYLFAAVVVVIDPRSSVLEEGDPLLGGDCLAWRSVVTSPGHGMR
jgi:hypothetical protein